MKARPQSVVCMSCSTKFHVPDELVRDKLVKFRCRQCGATIDVDGRTMAHAQVPESAPPPSPDFTVLETPASFSERTQPPQSANLRGAIGSQTHPWPEPPRTHTSTAPIAISEPPPAAPPMGGAPLRDPSNRALKIAALAALATAAGLSVVGFAMRTAPSESSHSVLVSGPIDPAAAPRAAAQRAGDPALARATRGATKVTDLPAAVDGLDPAAPARAPLPKSAILPSEGPAAPQENHPLVAAIDPPVAAAAEGSAAAKAVVAETSPAAPAAVTAVAAPPSAAIAQAAPQPEPVARPAPPPPPAPPATPAPVTVVAPTPVTAPAAVNRPRGDFNTTAAREALEDGAARASSCRTIDAPAGTARLAVTFAPTGQVTQAIIESGPFVGTAAGSCIAAKFRSIKIAPYSGDSVTVHKTIPF